MAVDVTTEVEINCHRPTVAAYASNPENLPAWNGAITSVDWLTSQPVTSGSRFRVAQVLDGRPVIYTFEVREAVADERLVVNSVDGPFQVEFTYSWEDTPSGGTRMAFRASCDMGDLAEAMATGVSAGLRVVSRKNLLRLKAILERRSAL